MKEKIEIFDKLILSLNGKIEQAQESIAVVKESRDNETKSSAGDKYETGREMMQIEINKSEDQLSKFINYKHQLSKIDLKKKFVKVEFGSLVETSNGTYFISIALGKIKLANTDYYPISLASPIGKLIYQKKEGDSIEFQGRIFKIIRIN